MTTIVAALNKRGIAIAADSAGSIGYKIVSADKIFSLKNAPSLGMATYGLSEIMGLPVSLIVSTYDEQLGEETFDKVTEYKTDFMGFLSEFLEKHHSSLYLDSIIPGMVDDMMSVTVDQMTKIAQTLYPPEPGKEERNFTTDEIKEAVRHTCDFFDNLLNSVSAKNIVYNGENMLPLLIQRMKDSDETGFGHLIASDEKFISLLESILKFGVFNQLFRIPGKNPAMLDTGIVFFGYGKEEIFPSMDSVNVYYHHGSTAYSQAIEYPFSIDFQANGSIRPFAQADMVMNIIRGIHPIYNTEILEDFTQSILENGIDVGKSEMIKNSFRDRFQQRIQMFQQPFANMIALFSPKELASIVETLVNLTSFKKRVTMVPEDVGGPVDIAIVTKKDGFIWQQCK